jgi:hypothetical protein
MARMHPEDIEAIEKATPGERLVFHFLQEAARPDSDFIGWYEPAIGEKGREPDFVLFSKLHGLLILEVKDWLIDQIEEADFQYFKVWIGGREENKTNPDRQARGYIYELMHVLKKFPEFETGPGDHQGQLKIPIGRMVVFPNISRAEYMDQGFDQVIPWERVLFQDDLANDGEIRCDLTGKKFQDRIAPAFPFSFKGLTPKEIYHLNSILYPVLKFHIPKREGFCKLDVKREVQALDDQQARVALKLKAGHQILKGPPGSGKTLVLINRCAFLQKYNPKIKRILLVCYNIALVRYLKRLLLEKSVSLGDEGVQVCHFYEICSEILGMPIEYDRPDTSYYDSIVQLTLDALQTGQNETGTFEAVLIDEGQDILDDMFRILLPILKPGGDLVIALDDFQDLYRREGSWKSLGIDAKGSSRTLKQVYRNTAEIQAFSQRFIGVDAKHDPQESLFPDAHLLHGSSPELPRFKTRDDLEKFVLKEILDLIRAGECRRSEIAIIYDDKTYNAEGFKYQDKEVPRQLLKKLESAGIPANWVSQDVRAKELFDITTDRVSLISIHSAKGLDFDLVYLVGADRIIPTDETRERLIRLLYVAITRAKQRLVIPYVEETEFISRFKACQDNPKNS